MQKRGFTLVELSIVVVIILMMTSYLAVNYFSVSQARGNQEVRARIDKINEAILNYAATHKTGGRDVEVFNNRPPTAVRVRWRIPAGRPYLPCPDITGDGLEDRIPPTATAITVTMLTSADSADPGEYVLEETGGCHSDRGALPWRTLNTPETDSWGNRFTYRVMPAFSSALTGFDQHARADTLPYRPLVTLAGGIVRDKDTNTQGGVQLATTFYDSAATQPSPWTGKFRIHPGPSLICDNAPCPHATDSTLIVGTLYAAPSPSPGVKLPNHSDFKGLVLADFPMGAASGGVPFVVVSHGRNGYGAIRGGGGEEFVCNPFPRGDTRFLAEKQNALWFNDINMRARAAGRFVCEAPGGTDSYNGIGFVDVPAHAPADGDQGFDDIVRWLSVDEIVEGLSKRGALPVRLLPPIGLEKGR